MNWRINLIASVCAATVGTYSLIAAGPGKPEEEAKPVEKTDVYKDAFSAPAEENAKAPVPAPASGAAPEAEEALSALRTVGSFPIRIRGGESPDLGWPTDDRRNYAPKPVGRGYKAGACEFWIKTSDFAVRRYERKEGIGLVVVLDPAQKSTTFDATVGSEVILSVTTEVFIDITEPKKAACKKLFADRHIHLGKLDLNHSTLTANGEGTLSAAVSVVNKGAETDVYLVWDFHTGRLFLEDAAGLPAALESSIYAFQIKNAGDYYLNLKPELGLTRSKSPGK